MRTPRSGSTPIVVGLVLLGLLVVASIGPAASASGPSGATLGAPFRGSVAPAVYLYFAGCGSATAPTPQFNLTTGNGSLYDFASSRSCVTRSPSSFGYDSSSVLARIELPHLPTRPTVYLNLTAVALEKLRFYPGHCVVPLPTRVTSGCDQLLSAAFSITTWIVDRSTGSIVTSTVSSTVFSPSLYNSSSCLKRICISNGIGANATNDSFNGTLPFVLTPLSALTTTHTFYAVIFVSITADAECDTFGTGTLTGCQMSGAIDLRPPTRGVGLLSLDIR